MVNWKVKLNKVSNNAEEIHVHFHYQTNAGFVVWYSSSPVVWYSGIPVVQESSSPVVQ